jgi:hypothetical protein
VKVAGLLLFMFGATDTVNGPDVAPDGMVIPIEVLLHTLIVTNAPFNVTSPTPPNPVPLITTWLPTEPVVADTPVMTGAGADVELIDTLSNLAVARVDVLRLLTAKPTYTFVAMSIVWLEPSCTQFTPSAQP